MRYIAIFFFIFLAILFAGIQCMADGSWMHSIEATSTNGTYVYTHDVAGSLDSVWLAFPSPAAGTNAVTVAVLTHDASATNYLASTNLPSITSLVVMPDAQRSYPFMVDWVLRVTSSLTNTMHVTVNRSR